MLKMLGANIVDDDIFHEESEHLARITSIESIVSYCVENQKDGQCIITHDLCKHLTSGYYSSPWDIEDLIEKHIGVDEVEFDPETSGMIINIAPNYITQGDDEGFTQSM